ncbi:MAG: hypothetical protein ACXVC6_06055 [Bacteroidia bacterium]
MKKTGFCFLLITVVLFALQSCSIEKRRYTSGFYVRHDNSLSKKNISSVTRETTVNISEIKRKLETEEILKKESKKHLLAGTNSPAKALPSLQNLKPTFKTVKDSCDTLVLTNGTEILTKILEIGPEVVRYKHCNNPDGPVYVVNAAEVNMIIFSNGTIEEFSNQRAAVPAPVISDANPYIVTPNKIEKTSNSALIFGLVAIPSLIFYLAGIVFAILAIIDASNVLKWYKREPTLFDPRVRTRAVAGMVLGIFVVSLVALLIIGIIVVGLGLI